MTREHNAYITAQKSNTWIKQIYRRGLDGHTSFHQKKNQVDITASGDHKLIVRNVLKREHDRKKDPTYYIWNDVSAKEVAEVFYKVAIIV